MAFCNFSPERPYLHDELADLDILALLGRVALLRIGRVPPVIEAQH